MAGIRDYSVISSGFIAVTTGKAVGNAANTGMGTVLHGIELIPDGTNAGTVTIYHGIAATSGNELAQLKVPATTTLPTNIIFNNPIASPDGLWIVVSGGTTQALVFYSAGS